MPQKYIKAVYREYTDNTFTVPRPRPAWAGRSPLMMFTNVGPFLHLCIFDRVTFFCSSATLLTASDSVSEHIKG